MTTETMTRPVVDPDLLSVLEVSWPESPETRSFEAVPGDLGAHWLPQARGTRTGGGGCCGCSGGTGCACLSCSCCFNSPASPAPQPATGN